VLSLAGATQDEVRRSNLSAVLRSLHLDGAQSRSHLTAVTGLNRSTVGDLVSTLASLGLVRERPGDVRGVGRPSLVVEPVAESVAVLALDLRVERTIAALFGLGGEVFARAERQHRDASGDAVIAEAIEVGLEVQQALPPGASLVGTCVGVPGVVRVRDGLVRFAPNLGWIDVALGDLLREGMGLGPDALQVRNDADLGVLAEQLRGSARGSSTVLYLAGDIGVGGGVFVDGRPLVGAGGYGGEVGHMRVNPEGHICRCGARGCWETEIGSVALLRAAGVAPGTGTVADVVHAAEQGDAWALAAFDTVAAWLGLGLVNLVHALNPEAIVLGGHLGTVYSLASAGVARQLEGALPASRDLVSISSSDLGGDASLTGASEVAFTRLLDDPVGLLRRSAAS
jgi:predicted NBD/HSP70 family sugar kinase